ncbi:uncharacterized protein [Montipora capricornis]
MSDEVPLREQKSCLELCNEDDLYLIDVFSCVQQTEIYGHRHPRQQLFLYITRAPSKSRSSFLQEEKLRLGLSAVHSDTFCWKKSSSADKILAILKMEDLEAIKQIERMKVDEMRLPEKVTYTLPKSDASSMQAVVKVLKGNLDGETLLKTEQLTFSLSMIERMKVDEMRLPEKVSFTLPKSDASSMQAVVKVLKGNLDGETLLQTEQLTLPLSMIPSEESRPGVEHELASAST